MWGVPGWAWGAGVAVGMAIGLTMFDNVIVGVIFGFSIGTAFAIAFAQSRPKRSVGGDGQCDREDAAPGGDGSR